MAASVLALKLCRDCRVRVAPKCFGLCSPCMESIEQRITEHRARVPRRRERCAKPTCNRPFREHERIAVDPSDLRTYCWLCYPSHSQEQS